MKILLISVMVLLTGCNEPSTVSQLIPTENLRNDQVELAKFLEPKVKPKKKTSSPPNVSSVSSGVVPEVWYEKPQTQMRLLSYGIKSQPKDIDISVVKLAGQVGGILANVNRWRGQLNLSPISNNELVTMPITNEIANLPGQLVILEGKTTPTNDYTERMLVAMFSLDGHIWFFKMMGEKYAVMKYESDFQSYVSKFNLNNEN